MHFTLGKGHRHHGVLGKCSFPSSWNMMGKLSHHADSSISTICGTQVCGTQPVIAWYHIHVPYLVSAKYHVFHHIIVYHIILMQFTFYLIL